jgi:hypothetical protein
VATGLLYGLLFGAIAEYARLDAQPRGTTDTRYASVVLIVMWTCLGLAVLQFFSLIGVAVYRYRVHTQSQREEQDRQSASESSV